MSTTLVTGGSGYIGALVVEELLRRGENVRVLDALIHGQSAVAQTQRAAGVEHVIGDVRDGAALEGAMKGADNVVHLAAIVGDPACARDPELAHETNVCGTLGVLAAACSAGVTRFVFASTCSNYGRQADPTVALDENAPLAPVSLYAQQKVSMEHAVLAVDSDRMHTTCLRFATVYGVAPRMRFDLTVNEFTRDLWFRRSLRVFGERFWRPYIHVRDAAEAVANILVAPTAVTGGEVFNIGRSDENYRKLDIVEEILRQVGGGDITFVDSSEDPRDYRVDFGKLRDVIGFRPQRTVPDGVRDVAAALAAGRFPDPYETCHRN